MNPHLKKIVALEKRERQPHIFCLKCFYPIRLNDQVVYYDTTKLMEITGVEVITSKYIRKLYCACKDPRVFSQRY